MSLVDTDNFERNVRNDHNYNKAEYSAVVPNRIVEAVAHSAADMMDKTDIVVAVAEVSDRCLGGKEWHGIADLCDIPSGITRIEYRRTLDEDSAAGCVALPKLARASAAPALAVSGAESRWLMGVADGSHQAVKEQRKKEMNADFGAPKELAGGLQQRRALYQPRLPPCLLGATVRAEYGDATTTIDPTCANVVAQAFPNTFGQPLVSFLADAGKPVDERPPIRVGVVYSRGGSRRVGTTSSGASMTLSKRGTQGLFANKTLEITDGVLASYKNQGGFDLLGRSVDRIRSTMQLNAAMTTCRSLNLDGLVIIGGVTSNSDAAQLAETLVQNNCKTKVVGVPVSLNGDLKNQFVETTVGFDTVCKVNSQLVSNVCLDAISAGKLILGEEVALSKLTLMEIISKICDGVQARAELGKYHGVLVIPEGLIESIPEMYALIQEINILHNNNVPVAEMPSQLSPWAAALFQFLPPFIRRELLLHQESDNSAQLSQIDTEQLLAHLVEAEMIKRTKEGRYKGRKFSSVCHFFGYQARGSLPSNFDCDYAYTLGRISLHMVAAGLTGYMATVANLKDSVDQWRCAAAPLTAMMSVKRHLRGPGAIPIGKPAIHPSPIDLKGKAYELLREKASSFLLDDFYRTPGGIQFEGPGSDAKPITLTIENQDYMGDIEILKDYLSKVRTILKPGCSREILKAAISSMASVTDVLTVMSHPLNAELPLYHFN
ncbi:hypothetical protein PR202_ga20675 [Eleusine coracana subsp. coracana]|uniref:Phosphofructokinase domain-containing protein n=1 Tax=Eleusine coracana subsp. coracana TaxID=191504 RepID=A0AAV5CZ88_ELECO|nr:hypothetical protein PR202_ga20675 [Eleusine coracana subsp. coracana]